VYFFTRGKKPSLDGLTREERKAAIDAWDKAQSLPLREAAVERRKILKRSRFEKLAERPDLVKKSIEEMRAIRRNMERRINEL
jgi:hypothetical protein